MQIRQAKPQDLEKVLDFYKSCNYSGGAIADDIVFFAEKDKRIIAAVRLCNENQVLVLRGMQVAPNFQRQGIGRALLRGIDKAIGSQTCFCIPYKHLEKFYGAIGFRKIENTDVPPHLLKRAMGYALRGLNMIIMKRENNQ